MEEMGLLGEGQPHVLLQKQMQHMIESQFKEIESLKAQEEKEAHGVTRSELRETQDRLDFAQGELEVLTKQLEREKAQFDRTFGALKTKALKETVKNVELENKCNVIQQQAEVKSGMLESREDALVHLNHRLQETEESYRRQLTDLSIQMQQDVYISQVLEGSKTRHTFRPDPPNRLAAQGRGNRKHKHGK